MRALLLAALLAPLLDSAAAQTVLAYRGTLAQGDQTLSSGEFTDRYTITVPRGATALMISMTSSDFDAYLLVRGPGGENEDNDDTGSGGTDATAVVFNPAVGEWSVVATSARPGERGAYELVLGAGQGSDIIARLGELTDADYRDTPGSATSPAPRTVSLPTPARPPKGGAAPTAAPQGASGMASVQITNRTSQPLFYLYASRCTDDGWGADRLGSDVISAGATYSLSLEPGCWDVKATFQDDQETEKRDWNLVAGSTTWTITAN